MAAIVPRRNTQLSPGFHSCTYNQKKEQKKFTVGRLLGSDPLLLLTCLQKIRYRRRLMCKTSFGYGVVNRIMSKRYDVQVS